MKSPHGSQRVLTGFTGLDLDGEALAQRHGEDEENGEFAIFRFTIAFSHLSIFKFGRAISMKSPPSPTHVHDGGGAPI